MRKMHLSSLFVLSIIVSSPVQVPFEGAYVQDSKQCLSWVCNTSAKIGAARDKYESWTLVSTRSYASSNKVPQEAIPADKEYQVKSEMLAAFAELIGAPDSALQVTASKLQLWGAAVPLNRHSASFVLDGKEKIGIAGDWFTSSAAKSPGIESAWASGRLLADELAKGLSSTDGVLADVGFKVDECFEACDGAHPLGDVTGFASIVQRASQRGPPLTPGKGAPAGVPSSKPTFKKKRY
jgi:predicted NAD/FAD-dependent oxidoreductase